MTRATNRPHLLPYVIIEAAVQGEPDAVHTVLHHYSGYIATLCLRTNYDEFGNPHSYVDEELRRRLETKLILAIASFRLN